MKVSELLESRRANWRELEQLCAYMEGRSRRQVPEMALPVDDDLPIFEVRGHYGISPPPSYG